MPNPVGALRHPLAAASTFDRPLPAILSEAYFSFCLFSLLFLSSFSFFFSPLRPPSSFPLASPTERQHIKTGVAVGGSRDEEDLRNADTAFPRLSGPLPFSASVFFPFYVAERLDDCLVVWSNSRTSPLHFVSSPLCAPSCR